MQEERVVEARMRLRERFLKKAAQTPALSDEKPQGTGPPNRHGMPKVPIGQKVVTSWPVLDLGRRPDIPLAEWHLCVEGACDNPLRLSWDDFRALQQTDNCSDFHCVTGWSKMDMAWTGVRLSDLAALAGVRDTATHVLCYGFDGYSTNLPLEEALKEDVMLVHSLDGLPLSREHGGPVRLVAPQLYAWKGAKWLSRVEFLEQDQLGYWERNGYSNTGHPWRDDRYAPLQERLRPGRLTPYLAPILLWMVGVLALTIPPLAWARIHHLGELAQVIEVVSVLAAFGSIPFAIRWRDAREGANASLN